MGRRLRIFISSTMRDLTNERRAVCQRLTSFNFEPVNAEGWSPSGATSWDRIVEELADCDLVVLLLGDKYGWSPTTGPMSQSGMGVTHLEYQEAKRRGLPILPFLKNLDYDADRASEDARKRDSFRKEVGDWAAGRFVGKFDFADDLAQSVGSAVIELLTSNYMRDRVARTSKARSDAALMASATPAFDMTRGFPSQSPSPVLPRALLEATRDRTAVLWAGAGISAAAGLPSASAMVERMAQVARAHDASYSPYPAGDLWETVASDLEILAGRPALLDAVSSILNLPLVAEPTAAHRLAVRMFDLIVTTNFDSLFEQASREERMDHVTISGEIDSVTLPRRAVVKLHGSLALPETLVLTEEDYVLWDARRKSVRALVAEVINRRPVVVVGTTLRDRHSSQLLLSRPGNPPAYYVVPSYTKSTTGRLVRRGFECLQFTADQLLESLARGA
jgi:hypothetical protein